MKIKGVQKLAFILLIILVSACHREFVGDTDQQQKLVVRNAVINVVPAAETKLLNWKQMERIESNDEMIGYKIPFVYNTPDSYSFILVNFSDNKVGTVYKNEVNYTPMHGGMYPVAVTNFNYTSNETATVDTKAPMDQISIKMGSNRPMSLMSAGLYFPAVATCGVPNELSEPKSEIAQFNTFILGYLLGFEENSSNSSFLNQKPTVAYYNPLASLQQSTNTEAVITWDIVK